ncbi:MAG: hypothetical protein ACFB13_03340 [Kiloniellaceae bacterium]
MTLPEAEIAALPAKIPIGRTLAEAYRTLLTNLWPFMRIALFPLALGVLLPYGWHELYGPLYDFLVPLVGSNMAFLINSHDPQWFADRTVDWLVLVLFMSHWLQFLATKEAGHKPTIVWVLSRADLRVLRYGLLLVIVPLCSMIVRLAVFQTTNTPELFAQTMGVFEAVFVLLVPASVAADCLVAGRSAPVFAAAAAGQPITLRQAWQATRRQTPQLMLIWLVLYWLTRLLAGPLQSVANDLYVTAVIALHMPGEYVGRYYLPPFEQLAYLPSALVHLIAGALGAFVFQRVYRRDAAARDAVLQRFE